jgi:hypothetical protein
MLRNTLKKIKPKKMKQLIFCECGKRNFWHDMPKVTNMENYEISRRIFNRGRVQKSFTLNRTSLLTFERATST